ncbi:MAG: cytochrome d ubiquinol oxidase subunit II [Prevotellamassilia sp.]|nr:cytochrome d ubiquinol oxidase subunit II [Prevotellamassilia sp.]
MLEILQQYWWLLISLLGGLLVFLLFVQGANSLVYTIGKTEIERQLIINSTGRKWEFTFTTLVTFGGAFFASFPLFYSTSFGGAYAVWSLILLTFVVQAVSYEFQSKPGNFLGKETYRWLLVITGWASPLLLGTAVGTLFGGAPFTVNKDAITESFSPVISVWNGHLMGFEALLNIWNIVLGLCIMFLARTLGALYLRNNIAHEKIAERLRKSLFTNALLFVICFIGFIVHLLLKEGLCFIPETEEFLLTPYKYLNNAIEMPIITLLFLVGVVCVLFGIIRTLMSPNYNKGIWFSSIGTIIAVTTLLSLAGLNDTAYYPSTTDINSSLCIANSSASEFTLLTMSVVSGIIPFVVAYIYYAWRKIDHNKLTETEIMTTEHKY